MTVDDLEFREFYAAQYTRLCWFGLLLTGDQTEAEELAQEALVRTWWRWALHRPNDPAAYARKVLVNRHRSLLRRAGVESRFLARTRIEPVPPPGDEQAMVLWQAVQGLPARQRAVLVLRFHEDLTEAEVARLLGLPLGTVKSLAHRGLARLRTASAPPTSTRPPPPGGRRDDPGTPARGPPPCRPPPPRRVHLARGARRL
jgi:RNA polymerase sigma-70 factor (sigma-E family)